MIYVGIDIAKDKHDCFITNSDCEVSYLNPLPSLTTVTGSKPFFRKYNPYQMI